MRNHHQKARDLARSLLPSTCRENAREDRKLIHRRERARARAELHHLSTHVDPDDFEGDLTWIDKGALGWMVWERRSGDKLGPILRWADHQVRNDLDLFAAPTAERLKALRHELPNTVIGRHAASHLRFHLEYQADPERRLPSRAVRAALVERIAAAGLAEEMAEHLQAGDLELTGEALEDVCRRLPAPDAVDALSRRLTPDAVDDLLEVFGARLGLR